MISLPIIILRLALALLLGGIIGLEREFGEHRAGMRTNALVSLGSALFTIVSAYGFLELLTLKGVQVDPSRVASYIVAGIGFLGAGTIVIRQAGASGLTTAAAIWLVAAIGMACGVGLYWEAVLASLLALLVLRGLRVLEKRLVSEKPALTLRLRLATGQPSGLVMTKARDCCAREGLTIETLRAYRVDGYEALELRCRFSNQDAALRVLAELRTEHGVDDGSLDFEQ